MDQRLKNVALRPLGIGEIFDRAITLLVRNWMPFTKVIAFIGVPVALLQFLPVAALADSLGATFVALACTAIVCQLYADEQPNVSAALKRMGQKIVSTIGLSILLGLTAVVPLGIMGVITVAVFGVYSRTLPLALLVASPFALAFAVSFSIFYFTQMIGIVTLIAEDVSATRAYGRAMEIVFHSGAFKRTLGAALAFALMMFGGAYGFGFGIAMLPDNMSAVGEGITSVAMVVLTAYVSVAATVYYFDIRVRHEGYDVERALDAMEAEPG